MVDGVKAGLVDACAALEKRSFAKHEAMDLHQEAKKRDVTLLAVLDTSRGGPHPPLTPPNGDGDTLRNPG